MLLYGASGHAKVILSCLKAANLPVYGIFDDDLTKKSLGEFSVVGAYNPDFWPQSPLVIAIGYNDVRQKIAATIQHAFGTVLHPSALIDESVTIGAGTVVFHNAVVQADAHIGQHAIVNTAASIDHDCRIADFVHIAPRATLCGNVRVGEGTLIGAGAVVAPNLTIGRHCLIAAGSVITQHIPDFAIVRGNPGRIIKRTISKIP
jgi:sugar O-acyltransferase (sialic acid O-acetyltransferase NeuD family)